MADLRVQLTDEGAEAYVDLGEGKRKVAAFVLKHDRIIYRPDGDPSNRDTAITWEELGRRIQGTAPQVPPKGTA